ncbi:hypothetical protein ACOMHN_008827 [Nucella lapillus]
MGDTLSCTSSQSSDDFKSFKSDGADRSKHPPPPPPLPPPRPPGGKLKKEEAPPLPEKVPLTARGDDVIIKDTVTSSPSVLKTVEQRHHSSKQSCLSVSVCPVCLPVCRSVCSVCGVKAMFLECPEQ